ncbi:MAG TPA: sn-glycerol-3-phosphate ABC transporter substrate-binding protein UgpB [Magnetospirillum sp.]|nr:sn-glycerol-3-phosphate ABC transporter substrate-binding protein UgpB [Magnetospirillum sp.]
MMPRAFAAMLVMLLIMTAVPAWAATELVLWHAMPGKLGEWLSDLVAGFNASQGEYTLVPVYKGGYPETMAAALAAAKTGQRPDVVQVFEVGTATMMAAKGVIKPVHEVMDLLGQPFDDRAYIPAVTLYYSSQDGKLLSMPLNSSTPVLFYDKTAFAKAGLDPAAPPKTWPEVETAALALLKNGAKCGFTTQWQSWIQLENLSAWHDMAFATKQNGIGGYDIELKFNSPFHVRHIQQLAAWTRNRVFVPHGRRDEALTVFKRGECPMLFASSASFAELKGDGQMNFGIGMLPIWPDVKWAPRNSIIGGATLWVMNGHDRNHYLGVARFFEYISSPEIQAASHQRTGYLPITREAYSLSRRQDFYAANPDTEVAVKQITLHRPTEHSKGVRLGNFVQIRDVIDEELDAVWAGRKDAQSALDDAVRRGNELLRRFNREQER